ncbi:hypothetical protein Tco_1360412 [Tanacetum coccineum]
MLGHPQWITRIKEMIDSGCSMHMTGNMSYLTDYEEIDGGYVAFGGNRKRGKITGKCSRPDWLFDIDALIRTINYEPIIVGLQDPPYSQDPKSSHDDGSKPSSDVRKKVEEDPRKDSECKDQEKEDNINNTNNVNIAEVKTVSTPMETQKLLLKDKYVCACARYQVNLKVSHLQAVKRIFRYLKGQPKLGLWYLKDSSFDLVAYTDSDYAGASLHRKSTTGDKAVHKELGDSLVRAATTTSSLEAEQDSGNIYKTQSKATPNESNSGGGPGCQETMRDTTALTRFESVSKHPNDSLLARGNTLRSNKDRLKLDELMALCTTLQNKVLDLEKTKTTQQNEIASLKRRVKKLEKKDRSRTHKLMRLYKVGLTARVESSDNEESMGEDASKQGRIDAIDADEEITLVSVHNEMEVDEEVVEVINTAKLIIDAAQDSAAGDIVSTASVATTISTTTTTTTTRSVDDITLAQALEEMKSTKPKKKGVVIQELGESTTTIPSQLSSQQSQNKGKGILIKHVMPIKKKNQISLDEETALNLQAEFDEEERLAREKAEKGEEANIALIETWDDIQAKIDADHQLAERMQAQEQEELIQAEFDEEERLARKKAEKEKEANIALIETWDNIRAKIDADHQLAERLQAQEQEELSIEEKATLFQKLLDKRRKHFTAKRAEEKRNKPPTKAQQRKIMCTYLKNMEGYKLKDLKLKEFDSIQEMFDKAFKRVNTFEDFRT